MSTTQWNPASHLVSPDGKWYWDGAAQEWKPIGQPASEPVPTRPPAPAQPSRGLNSFAGTIRSEDLAYGQTVLVWARWILIGTGLLLSFWSPKDLLTLQIQLAAIIALAFGNFYLHVQLLRGQAALEIAKGRLKPQLRWILFPRIAEPVDGLARGTVLERGREVEGR